jgi:hypothetical protein
MFVKKNIIWLSVKKKLTLGAERQHYDNISRGIDNYQRENSVN